MSSLCYLTYHSSLVVCPRCPHGPFYLVRQPRSPGCSAQARRSHAHGAWLSSMIGAARGRRPERTGMTGSRAAIIPTPGRKGLISDAPRSFGKQQNCYPSAMSLRCSARSGGPASRCGRGGVEEQRRQLVAEAAGQALCCVCCAGWKCAAKNSLAMAGAKRSLHLRGRAARMIGVSRWL